MARGSFHQGRALLLAAWLGAGLFLAAAVAPGAFAVLPTSELAGRVVGRALTWLNIAGVVLGIVLAAYAAGEWHGRVRDRPGVIEYGAIAALLFATASTEFVLNPRIARLRSAHDIASLAPDDPVRAEFGMLHGASVVVFAAGLLAAALALLMLVRRGREY